MKCCAAAGHRFLGFLIYALCPANRDLSGGCELKTTTSSGSAVELRFSSFYIHI